MTQQEAFILESYGWTIECESPLEIRAADGSFASGRAASIVLEYVKNEEELK